MQSRDVGKSWADISLLAGQVQSLGQTYALLSYAPRFDAPLRLLAATETGLYFVVDTDTGIWRPLENQLPLIPRTLNWTNFSRSNIAELFASTDSGMYMMTPKANTVGWFKSLNLKSYAVTSYGQPEPTEWFAATVDGVYRLTNTAGIGNARAGVTPDRPTINTVHHRRVDIQGRVTRGAGRGEMRMRLLYGK